MRQVSNLLLFLFLGLYGFTQSVIDSEEVLLMNDSIRLPGTLTFNKKLEKQPLVIFVHGSRGIDRDGNQKPYANANYIQLLAEALHKKDIAFFRYDKRTSTLENSQFLMNEIVIEDFVKDLNTVINYFKEDKRFSSINLIGHSQGSLVAMLSNLSDIDKYISLAGPGESIDKTLFRQVKQMNGDSIANILKSHLNELKETDKIENLDPNLFALLNPTNQKFVKSWMMYDPKQEISKLKIPTLIINGDKDLQVKLEDAKALHSANKNSKLVLIENMNHMLKTIIKNDDNLKSYSSPDFPLSEELVKQIVIFLKQNNE